MAACSPAPLLLCTPAHVGGHPVRERLQNVKRET
jgi:hypothetical protein